MPLLHKSDSLHNLRTGEVLARRVFHCTGFFQRLQGLLGMPSLGEGEACWLDPCRSIHTFGMRYAIDVVALDRNRRVTAVIRHLKPWRFSPVFWNARSVLEFRSPLERSCDVGDSLDFRKNATP